MKLKKMLKIAKKVMEWVVLGHDFYEIIKVIVELFLN
jgi:hypothetical protein